MRNLRKCKLPCRSYKNRSKKARRLILRQRLHDTIMRDRVLDGGLCILKEFVKGGFYWFNCVKSYEGLWYIN